MHEFGTPEYNTLLPEGIRHAGSRAAIVLDLIKVSTVRENRCHFFTSLLLIHSAFQTCGYSVPLYEFKSHRGQLLQWAAEKEATDRESELAEGSSTSLSLRVQPESGMKRWWKERNTKSLDGQRGLISAPETNQVFQPTTNTPSQEDAWDTAPYFKIMGAIDLKSITAFLLGVLLASSYGRFTLVAQHLLKKVDIVIPNPLS